MDVFDYLAICRDKDFYDSKFMIDKYNGQYMDAFFIYKSTCDSFFVKDKDNTLIIYDKSRVNDINFELLLRRNNGDIFNEIKESLALENTFMKTSEISEIYLNKGNNNKIINAYKFINTNIITRKTLKELGKELGVRTDDFKFSYFTEYVLAASSESALMKSLILNYYACYISQNEVFGRIIHLWFLLQNGYNLKETYNISKVISTYKNSYDEVINKILENKKLISYIDITPYLNFMISKLNLLKCIDSPIFLNGEVTKKEESLFLFAREYFEKESFSSKDLEKAYNNSSYETIRKFLIKFTSLEYLKKIDYSSRPRYVVL